VVVVEKRYEVLRMTSQVQDPISADKPEKKLKLTVRSADGETAKVKVSLDDTLQTVLNTFQQETHFTVAGNQIPFFEFNGKRYEDLTQPVRVIEGLEDGDEIALLIRPRAG
jgi:hypothetical protein